MSGGAGTGAGYRTSPRPLAKLAPPAPWWRLAWAWCRGVFGRVERARVRRTMAYFGMTWRDRDVESRDWPRSKRIAANVHRYEVDARGGGSMRTGRVLGYRPSGIRGPAERGD